MSSHKSQQHLPNISFKFEFMSGLYLLKSGYTYCVRIAFKTSFADMKIATVISLTPK